MAKVNKNCPKCGSGGKKKSGKVMLLSTHRTYGYGERVYQCRKCGELYSIFYPIPPKSGVLPPKPDNPCDCLLRPRWTESISGHAASIVFGADVPNAQSVESNHTEPEHHSDS
jgi:hypothetical protein